jgi:Reverse transcriptase (RNA-dependent DNA polymerase)/RNase H-like domain found in reverse transcriptase/Integrase zinc binding domain/Chromo (CHRromatin Organisation MOdifier) domain
VNGTPSLFVNKSNKYWPLNVEEARDDILSKDVPRFESKPKLPRKKRWERKLPQRYVIATTPGTHSLQLSVQVRTTDTGCTFGTKALLDSGATGLFVDLDFVKRNRINTRQLTRPIPVNNVDGTTNESGPIREVVDLVLTYDGHNERTVFAVTGIGKQDIIIGFPWLKEHNPEVDWTAGKVKMSRCPERCNTCKEERKIQRVNNERIAACRTGPFPHASVEDGMDEDDEDEEIGEYEAGDKIFAATILPLPQEIRATGNFSQRLAEAHFRNSTPKSFSDIVPNYLHDFQDVFAKESFDALPERKQWDHAIELVPDPKLANCKVYPMSVSEQEELDRFIAENLKSGRIRPSKSPMASPCFFIKKKDGSLRLIQDYRTLNAITVKNRYPLPLISELVNKLRNAKYFTKLDVRWGYNNVRIKQGDEWKAAFRTNRGLFEPLVMMFGLTNAPATFQTMMNDIFADLIAEGKVCVYLDDILIFTADLEEHKRITRLVLQRLREHQLFLKPDKCEFEKKRIEYLGLIISEGRIEMDPVKVAGVAEWPKPTSKKEVQQFVGFANFYRRFIQDYSKVARPLFDLTGKAEFKWGEDQDEAFNELRRRITSTPILIFPNENKPFRIEADSSDVASGAVLSQQSDSDDKWHPVAFYSKSLSAVERNYDIYDKEMLAVIRAMEEWRHFLEGAKYTFEVWTDHKNLEYFRSAQKLNRRQARWSLYLSRFNYTLHHRPGKTMGKPDALSRRSDHGDGSGDNSDIVLLKPELFVIRTLEGLTIDGENLEITREIRARNRDKAWEDSVAVMVQGLKDSKARSARSAEWKLEHGLIFYRDRIYVPNDAELRRKIVAQHHDTKIAGHPGRWKTLELVSRNYWWPRMSVFIGIYCSTCNLCLRTKPHRQAPYGELVPLPIPLTRWDTISVDFISELPESSGYDAIMVVVDSVSKRAHFIPTHTTITASGSASAFLHNVWKLHGLPCNVVSDRGPQFVAEFMREVYRLLDIKMCTSTAYHPQTDGQTERVNQELEQFLRLFVNERQSDWHDLLPMAEFQYNNHRHSATQSTPFLLDTGLNPRMGFEPHVRSRLEGANEFVERMKTASEEARAALAKAKDDMAKYYNRHRLPDPDFHPGDKVFLDSRDIKTTRPSDKLAHRYLGPYPIERKVGRNAYRLRLPAAMSRLHPVFNVVKLRKAPEDPIFGRRTTVPPPPVLVDDDGNEEYEIEEVLDSRVYRRKLQFLVHWKGYGYEDNSWVNDQDIHAPDAISEFYRLHPGAPRLIRTMDFARIPFR